jgi:hypothetical protein
MLYQDKSLVAQLALIDLLYEERRTKDQIPHPPTIKSSKTNFFIYNMKTFNKLTYCGPLPSQNRKKVR